jgi:putative transposase
MKPIRLLPEAYCTGHIFTVTIRTAFSRPVFHSPEAVHTALAALRQATAKFDARVYAFCFMPDHLHLLARTPPDVDLLRFVNYFKQVSGLGIRETTGDRGPVWQPRFYDHALRSTEGILPAVRYILGNPVRARLVPNVADYPYSGSFEWPGIISAGLESPGLHSSVVPER